VDVDLESLGKRGGWGGETYEREDFQRKVHEHYIRVREANWHMVPGDRTRDEVHAEILSIVLPLLDKVPLAYKRGLTPRQRRSVTQSLEYCGSTVLNRERHISGAIVLGLGL
jgi:hypothetical protein